MAMLSGGIGFGFTSTYLPEIQADGLDIEIGVNEIAWIGK